MRSIRLSTHHTKTNFRQIFEYGAEALGNRRKELILIALVFLVLPQVILAAAWAQASADAVAILGNWTNKAPIDVLEALWLSAADDVAPALGL